MKALRPCLVILAVLMTAIPRNDLIAGSTGKIAGVVRDVRTSEPLPGVNVVVQGTALGASTDVEGNYVILNVPPGRYTVTASFIGYTRFEIRDLSVSVDFTTPLDLNLQEGSVELDAIVVQAERSPLIRQDLTNPVASISSETIEALPITDISQVIGLQAGVVVDDDGSIHIRGGFGNEISYTLNGVNINNPFGNTRSVGVAINAVQEVSLSSGTFNAEYGQALSGVVNYVTKDGGSKWTGNVRHLTGDYASNRSDLFFNISDFNPWAVNRTEFSIGGPLVGEDISVFVSGVYAYNQGQLFGQRLYLPEDSYLSREGFPAGDPRRGGSSAPYYFGPLTHDTTDLVGGPGGGPGVLLQNFRQALLDKDTAIVPLDWARSYNVMANLSYRIAPTMKLKYEFMHDFYESPSGNALAYRYKPDGQPLENTQGVIHSAEFTHTVSERMFYTLKGSYIVSTTTDRAFDEFDDPRYLPDFYARTLPNTSYLTGGVELDREWQKTRTFAGKADMVAQMFGNHEVKAGLEIRKHVINYEFYTLQFRDPNDPFSEPSFTNVLVKGNSFKPYIPTVEGGYTYYERKPLQMAAYVQDKIELFRSIILNLGLRYDYFDPAARHNSDISGELSAAGDTLFLTKGLTDASVKHMVQPRFSVSYPITDQGTIRFSYGHFYQIGSLSSLYRNPNFRSPRGTPSFGNPDVKPQRSIQYEVGLQQGLTPDLRLEVTAYSKDVKDYIYSQPVITARGDKRYRVLTNLSYANVRGISISLLKRRSLDDIFSASIDYTFQIAEGARREPEDEIFFNEQKGRLSETFLVPQDFDRMHTLTSTVSLTQSDDWSVSIIGYVRTGTPYTPDLPASVVPIPFVQNSDRQPIQWNVDLKVEKFFSFGPMSYSVFVQVDNLFDTENELYVYQNSGRALYNIEETINPALFNDLRTRIARGDPGMVPLQAIDRYYANPANVNRPRLVRFGASIIF